MDSESLRPRGLLEALRRRAWLVLACVVLAPAAAFFISRSQDEQYTASASLLFDDPAYDQQVFDATNQAPSRDVRQEGAKNVWLISLDVVSERTARRVGGGLTQNRVSDKIDLSPEAQQNGVSIAATDEDPRRAARIANTFAREYIAFRRQGERAKVREAQQLVRRKLRDLPASERKTDEGKALRERAQDLDLLVSLQTGNAELVQPARTPDDPSSPRPLRDAAIGLLLGLVLGLALALLADRLDRRIKDPRELEETFERPILGSIPDSRAISRSTNGLPGHEAEAFRLLRANLRYFNVDREIASVLVTSAAPGDGKSTVAWNLAAAAADAGTSVLLLEADLRHPALGERLGIDTGRGLSQLLAGVLPSLESAVHHVALSGSAGDGRRGLDVIVAGALPPNPTDLIESERMQEVIREAEERYDLVVIDTPPTSIVSDAIPLVNQVSGVIVVSRFGRSTRDSTAELRDQLRNLHAPTLGVVVNAVDSRDGYGYGSRYYRSQAAER